MELKAWCDAALGRQKALAEHLGKSPSTVSQAVTGTIRIPPDWYRGIVEFTNGEVDFADLAPAPKAEKAGAA
jgi:DNA-binding transcriptional regulator YdaS (Cro superfamily)